MSTAHNSNQNHLLSALPAAEFGRVAAHLQLVMLRLGEVLYEPGGKLEHAYFPTSAIVSLHYVTGSGRSGEIAGVGNEGMVGVSLFMGGDFTCSAAMVQTAGHAYRLEANLLKQAFDRPGRMQDLLLRYTQALITQISQNGACNRHHSMEQQLCRWLLLNLDRSPSNQFIMTEELIASILGVCRERITEAAKKLLHAGFIGYRRAHIAVLDRTGLESCACECYAAGTKELIRLLPGTLPVKDSSGRPLSSLLGA
jgi:CRP-like cAMP-binding protein